MDEIGTVKRWTYKGLSAEMLVTEANYGIARAMKAKAAIENAYATDDVSVQVMQGRHGLKATTEATPEQLRALFS